MSAFEEIGEIPEKYRAHSAALKLIFVKYKISGLKALVQSFWENPEFKVEWKQFWTGVARDEGGKLSLTALGIIVGSALGGVGIALMGGAFGLPLAGILGLTGFVSGSTIDSQGYLRGEKRLSVRVSKDCFNQLEAKAKEFGIPVKQFVKQLLEFEAADLAKLS